MADTWARYFGGVQLTPGQIRDEQERRGLVTDAMRGVNAHPEQKMAYLQSHGALDPVPTHRPGEVWGDMGRAAYSAADVALKVLDSLGRGRDAAFRAAQEVSGPLINAVEGQNDFMPREGNWNPGAALRHLASIPSNMVAPLTGARVVGGYGEPDDWRQYATPGNAMAIDMATDLGNWLPLPTVGAAKNAIKAARGSANAVRSAAPAADIYGQAIRALAR